MILHCRKTSTDRWANHSTPGG